jgi:hypothetical protein
VTATGAAEGVSTWVREGRGIAAMDGDDFRLFFLLLLLLESREADDTRRRSFFFLCDTDLERDAVTRLFFAGGGLEGENGGVGDMMAMR